MHLLRALLIASPLLTACVDSAAPTNDFTCLGHQPATAVAPASARGLVLDEIGGAAIANAGVEIHAMSDDALLGNAETGSTGSYAIALAAVPPIYRRVTADGFVDSFAYDPAPLTGSEVQAMLTRAETEQLYATVGLVPDPARGTLLVTVVDCNGETVRGATVTAPSAQRIVYLGDDTHFDPAATATSDDSTALVLGVPAGPVELEVKVGDLTYPAWPIASHAGALVTMWARP